MSLFVLLLWALSACLQMGLLVMLWCVGAARLRKADAAPLETATPEAVTPEAVTTEAATPDATPYPLPPVGLIIPCAGYSADMESALHSLLRQDYPALTTLLVTHGSAEPARQLALSLAAQYPHARHVEAGAAEGCGQKNRNLLDALQLLDPGTAVYVFCDANHLAKQDFIRKLTEPVILGQEKFCSGYRRTSLLHAERVAAAYHILVWHLGLLQSLPAFTQPWGGAFAADAASFRELSVDRLWATTVVDDVSLAGLLMRKGIRVRYCPQAILHSPLRTVSEKQLQSWLFRQLFYPKFYTRAVWLLLGTGLFCFAASALISLGLLAAWALGYSGELTGLAGRLALIHLLLPLVLQEILRRRAAPDCQSAVWRQGLRLAVKTLFSAFCRTIASRSLEWRGIRYHLNPDGLVLRVER